MKRFILNWLCFTVIALVTLIAAEAVAGPAGGTTGLWVGLSCGFAGGWWSSR